jgi:hypothetical protein
VFNSLDIPIYFYLIAFGIGLIVGLWKRDWISGALVAYLFFILTETVLVRKEGVTTGFRPELFWSWKVPGLRSQIYSNIILFIPIGVLLGMKIGWKSIPIALGCSLVIELIQLASKRGLFEFDDVIHNTLGAAIGFGLWVLVRKGRENGV